MKKFMVRILIAGIAAGFFSSVAESAPRKVLAELITSTTCAPCYAPDNFYFYQWLPSYGGAEMIVTIAYHVWWPSPGNDPMYLANPTPVQIRNNFYQATGGYAPRMFIDGFVDGTSNYPTWPNAIEPRFIDPSPITIALTGTRNGLTLNMNARIVAEMPLNSSNWRVHWVVTEDNISAPQNSPSGYVPFIHHAAHRNMYPDANGTPITISQGQTVNVPRVVTLNSTWVASECKVIAFVQDMSTKKVQNVQIVNVDQITSVGEGPGGIPETFTLAQNFPNPFNPATTISYGVTRESFVTLKVVNLLGEEVRTLVSESKAPGAYNVEWDGKNNSGVEVPSGVYLYRMVAGDFQATRKMTLMR